jgi:hypothetical protein
LFKEVRFDPSTLAESEKARCGSVSSGSEESLGTLCSAMMLLI